MDIKLCEAWQTISHQMLHSKQWLLGCPFANFASSSYSSSLLLLSHLVTSTNNLTRQRGRRGGRNNRWIRQRVNFRINWRLIFSSWRCTRLRRNHDILNEGGWNNQTGKPMVKPGRDNVAIYGAPMFPKRGKGLGFPSKGIPWSVDSGFVAICFNLRSTKEWAWRMLSVVN